LWEIKPDVFLGWPRNQAKLAALNEYVTRHKMNACVINLARIEQLERAVAVQAAMGV